MLNTGTNVNVSDNKNKSTPLHLAVNQGNDAGVKALLASRHCDVNCQVRVLSFVIFVLFTAILPWPYYGQGEVSIFSG